MKRILQSLLSLLVLAVFTTGSALAQDGDLVAVDADLPPNAQPGECYARVMIPEQYKTTSERVLVKEASERIETIPAVYRTETERVLIKEASERIETIPATYETVTERVLVKPAYTTWKKGTGPIQRVDNATGEIMCLVEVPAEYKTVTKRVLKTPATTRTVTVPAEYRTIEVRKLAEPARERRITIPEEYDTVVKREKVSEGHLEWRSILCETNTTPGVVASMQRALKSRGFDPGRVDGVIGGQTLDAVRRYQRSKGMAVGQLTIETLKSLAVL